MKRHLCLQYVHASDKGFLAILLSEMGHRVTAVDAAQGMLEHASKNAAQRGPVFMIVAEKPQN